MTMTRDGIIERFFGRAVLAALDERFGATGGTVTDQAWDGSAARFNDDQYQQACAACDPAQGGGAAGDTVKQRCFLPHHEPDGRINSNGVQAAAQRVSSLSGHSPDAVATAKAHLRSHYTTDLGVATADLPDGIATAAALVRRLASRGRAYAQSPEADEAVTNAIADLSKAVDAALTAQGADPDTDDPLDAAVTARLNDVKALVDAAVEAQAKDAAASATGTTPPPPVPSKAAVRLIRAAARKAAALFTYQPQPYHADPDETVECPSCQKMDDTDAKYCDQCGFKLMGATGVSVGGTPVDGAYQPDSYKVDADETVQCPRCGDLNDTDASYCDQCGLKLADNPDVQAQASPEQVSGQPAAPAPPSPAATAARLQAALSAYQQGDASSLIDWFNNGADGQINWCSDGDFDDCVDVASAHLDNPEGFCNERHQDACGGPPGSEDSSSIRAAAGDTPGNAKGVPADGDDSPDGPGDIDPAVKCQNPDCGHLAAAHEDQDDGENRGACTMQNCDCPGLVASGDQLPTGDSAPPVQPTPTGRPAAPPAAAGTSARAFQTEGVPSGDTLPPPSPGTAVVGPAFSAVLVNEGVPTDDGRMVAPNALTWRDPPLPLMWLDSSAHDPNGYDQNDAAQLVGTIESVERDGTQIIGHGHFHTTDEGLHAAAQLEQMGRYGVSIDVGGNIETESALDDLLDSLLGLPILADDDVVPVPPPAPEGGDDGTPAVTETLTKGLILGATGCPMAAFRDAYIVLGETLPETPPAQPVAPAGVQAAALAWHVVGGLEACEPCEAAGQVVEPSRVLRAAGIGPLAPPSAWFTDPGFHDGDDRLREVYDPVKSRYSGRYGCPITVTPDGEVYGHLAVWGVCHTSPQYRDRCMLAPRSRSDYAYWYRGQVLTAEGDLVDTGALTAGMGHAPETWGMGESIAHYDNTRYAVANVAVGEDDYGIWVHGAVHPQATAEQVYTLRASSLSGDWRPRGRDLELVGALAVNVPGFPIAKAHRKGGRITSLVASSPVYDAPPPRPLTVEERLSAVERGYRPLVPLAVAQLRDRMARIRS